MKLTRERKILAGVLLLAVAALGFDQLTGSPPSDSSDGSAAEQPQTLLLASAPSSASAMPRALANAMPLGEGPSLARRLNDVAPVGASTSLDQIRDVFRIPHGWFGAEAKPEPRPVSADKLAAERFLQVHKLTAISKCAGGTSEKTNGADVAVVDGKLLHPGALVDGFRLVAITRTAAVFDCDGAQVLLTLKNEASANGSASDTIGEPAQASGR